MIKAIDFCCGAGGLTRGLLDAGISVLAGVDNDERLRETYERNNKPSAFVADDIAALDIAALRKRVGIEPADTTLYAAAALQTFPDDYEFFGNSFFENARQIGNAVPVRFAEQLGQAVILSIATPNSRHSRTESSTLGGPTPRC